MKNPRCVVKTQAGVFFHTPDYQVATIGGETIRYKFAHELRAGDKVLIRKDTADLSLQEDILPTLWIRSPQYREDRAKLFIGNGPDLPTQTMFGQLLNNAILRIPGSKEMDKREIAVFLQGELSEKCRCSVDAVKCWMDGKVIFPQNPDAVLELADRLGSSALMGWGRSIIEDDNLGPVARLRTVHRMSMAMLASPKNQGAGETSASRNHSSGQTRVSMGPVLEALEQQYGNNIFEEIVTPTTVMRMEFKDVGAHQANGSSNGASYQMSVQKDLIGFGSGSSMPEKHQVLSRYVGAERSGELDAALAKRRDQIMQKILPLIMESSYFDSGLRYNAKGIENAASDPDMSRDVYNKVLFNFSLDAYNLSTYLYPSHWDVGHITKDITLGLDYKLLLRSDTLEGKRLASFTQSSYGAIIRDGPKMNPFLAFNIAETRRVYDGSTVLKHVIPFDEWFRLVGAQVHSSITIARDFMTIDYARETRERVEDDVKILFEDMSKPALKGAIAELRAIEASGRIPQELIYLQHNIWGHSGGALDKIRFLKLQQLYGVSSFYVTQPTHEAASQALNKKLIELGILNEFSGRMLFGY